MRNYFRLRTSGKVLLLTFILPISSLAQITFERTYGDTFGYYWGQSVQQTLDEGYIIAGWTRPVGEDADFYLIKTDSLGDTLWTRAYGGILTDYGSSVQQTSDGGYIIIGRTTSFGPGPWDIYLVKTNSMGDSLWAKTYGETSFNWGWSVQETSDMGYILTGYTGLYEEEDIYLIKTDSLGDSLWTKKYGGSQRDVGRSVQVTSDGGFIIAGYTNSFGAGGWDVYLVKTDSLGVTLWTQTYGGFSGDYGYAVQQTSDGGYIITGMTTTFGPGLEDVYLIKTDSLGDTLWTRAYGGVWRDEGHSVQQTTDGGYIIAGYTNSFGSGAGDFYLIKTDSLGGILWQRVYGGDLDDWGWSVQQTLDGGYIVTGLKASPGSRGVYLIKTNGNGLVVGVEEKENAKFKMNIAKLLQNQPNPFHHSTLIRYALPVVRAQGSGVSGEEKLPVRLTIYDLTGRLVETLVDESQESGVYQVQWEGKDQASGVYFYSLTVGAIHELPLQPYTSTRKMILLR